MRNVIFIFLLSFSALYAIEYNAELKSETRIFRESGLGSEQKRSDSAAIMKLELYHDLENGLDRFAFTPFLRAQMNDSKRSHFDIRELYWERVGNDWEIKFGIGQEYWGVTEFVHLVNVINQVDSLESVDEEERLGEFMLKYTRLSEVGQFDFFILPGFRPRAFPGIKGRQRTPFVLDSNDSSYESNHEERKIETAFRYSQTFDNIDLGLSLFHGIQRDTQVKYNTLKNKMVPYYAVTTQFGSDIQIVIEDWLLKTEIMTRRIDSNFHKAITGGFEYSMIGIFDSGIDLGLIVEGSWQNKRDRYSFFSDEIMFGHRLAFNNELSSDLLFGVIYDIYHHSSLLSIEASSRINNSLKINLEGRIYQRITNNDPLKVFENEDHINLAVTWYF
jgi:hypothetical protein